MSLKSLEDVLQAAGNPVNLLRNSQTGPSCIRLSPENIQTGETSSVPGTQTCVLFDQSYHMTDMYVQGPDALRLLSDLGVNEITDPEDGLAFGLSQFRHPKEENLEIVGVPGVDHVDMNFKPFDLPAAHIYKIGGGKIHEIEAMGFMMPYNSKRGWE